jgi:HupE / UreJ protein
MTGTTTGTTTGATMRALSCSLIAVAALTQAQPVGAHPLDLGYLRLEASGESVKVDLDLAVTTATAVLGLDEATGLDGSALRVHAESLADATFRGAPITTERGPCRWTTVTASRTGQTIRLSELALCPDSTGERRVRWALPFVAQSRVAPTFQLLVKARLFDAELVTTIDRHRPTLEFSASATLGFTEFVWSGIEHIGAAPGQWRDRDGWKLPDGVDHILFLLALMLAGGSLLQLVGITSGFTLGHSITLALSALGVVRPSPGFIEPLIALSIAVVAAEAFWGRAGRRRWKVAAFFGLIHGFGFAGALNELQLSSRDTVTALAGYNLGVELGQIAIVLALAPLILLLQRNQRAHRLVVRAISSLIFIAGICWFVQRLFD